MSTYITKRADELGVPVVDATEPIIIGVTQGDIDKSVPKDSKVCGFARACERQLKDVRAAYFFKTKAWLEYDDKLVRYKLPQSVQKEIIAFDRSRSMEPGVYKLSPINRTETMKYKAAQAKKNKGRTHKGKGKVDREKMFKHFTKNVRHMYDPTYRAGGN